jgi:glycosyltransferase involved in cell wall biosynthesis
VTSITDPPLSILHVDPERGIGGGEEQVLGLLRHLAGAGQRQTVAAHPDGQLAGRAAALGVAVEPLAIRNHADVLAGRRLAAMIARGRFDVVHFHTARAHAMSAFLGRSRAAVRIVTRRMDYPLAGGWYARRLYNAAVDAVIAISAGVEAALLASGVEAAKIRVIASGVDLDRFTGQDETRARERARLGIAPAETVVAAIAALEPRKGHAVLLEALALLGDLPLRVLCAGGGSQAAALAARTAALGVAGRVCWLGHVPDVLPVLAAADVVVMPSLLEGLGVAALEAMAAGRPVIASRVGGLPEAVGADGAAGVLVPPGDPAELAAALRRLAGDPARAVAIGAAGRERARRLFAMSRMADATLALYRDVRAAKGGRRVAQVA